MNKLVFEKGNEAVTDSLTVASVFEKRHDNIIKDIRNLECSHEFSHLNFKESIYKARGKEYPKFYITQDGFSFLVMGYTGKKAAKFKEDYIQAFRGMERELNKPRVLTEKEQLIASMKLSLETSQEISDVKGKVNNLEERLNNELNLRHGQATKLNFAIKKRVEKLWNEGIVGSLVTKQQMYSKIYSQLYRAFNVPTYREVKRLDFEESLNWVSSWRPI